MNRLIEALHSGRVLLMDGAMGTELQRLGLADGEPPELWNLTHSEQVCTVHRAYLEAGAEVLLTNTFQANPGALGRHGLADKLTAIWDAALFNAGMFTDASPFVLADIGPLAGPTDVIRDFESERERESLQFLTLCRGADGLLLETWDSFNPMRCMNPAIFNGTEEGLQLPLLMSFSFEGESPTRRMAAYNCANVAKMFEASAIGANCGAEIDMDDLLEIVQVYRRHNDLPIFVRPNAGTATRTPDGWEYPRSPEYMADKLWPLLEAGVTMVGGCCGTTPAHIAAFRRVVDEWNARHARK